MHRRHVAPFYRFVYRVFYVLVDIDRLDELDARLRLFSHNRFNLLALHDRDHGDGMSLRDWAERVLCEHGVALAGDRKSVVEGKRVSGGVGLGGRRTIKTKKTA